MSSDLSQLDQLIESDVLEALGQEIVEENHDMGDGLIQNVPEEYFEEEEKEVIQDITSDSSLEESLEAMLPEESEGEVLDDIGDIEILPLAEIESALEEQEDEDQIDISSNGNDLASILTKLLTNKTIEITIKIKD